MIEAQIVGTGPLPAGTLLQGRYRILSLIGSGGTSRVYQAEDTDSGGSVAVKEMLSGADGSLAEDARRRCEHEAHTLADLSHPAIPDVLAFFSQDDCCYLVLEFVEGETLQQLLQRTGGPFPENTVAEWACQVCDVLSYLHGQRPPLVFRDLKPSNIMLDAAGQIKLIDFGIARFFKPGREGDTESMGTAGYSSPEQYGAGQTDARSDVYSLGACIHFLLTRRNPGESPFAFPPARQLNAAVSAGMDRIVARCLNMSPDHRYQSARELKEALTAQRQSTSAIAGRPPGWQPVGPLAPAAAQVAHGSPQHSSPVSPQGSQAPQSDSSPANLAPAGSVEPFAAPASLAGACLKHTDATQVTVGGRKVCRSCAEESRCVNHRILLCQQALVVLLPVWVLVFCLAAARFHVHPPSHRHIAWWPVSFVAAFFASWMAALVTQRAAIRRDFRAVGSKTVVRPFDFRHRLRDLNLLGLLFAAAYSTTTLFTPGAVHAAAWFHWRAPAILICGGASLLLLLYSPLSRGFTRHSFVPQARRLEGLAAAALYVLSLLIAVPLLSQVAAALVRRPIPESWLLAPSALLFLALSGAMGVILQATRHADPDPAGTGCGWQLPLTTGIALIGPSNVGKTVFLTRAFHLLEQKPHGAGFRVRPVPETPRQLSLLRRLVRRLHEDRSWPDPTVEILRIPLTLTLCGDEIIRFRWMDVPGGAITHGEEGDDENIYGTASREYEQHLVDCHAVLLLIDAEELASRSSWDQVHQAKSYFDQMDRLVDRLKLGRAPGGVPLAIVVTKCCRVTRSREEMQKLLDPLIKHWRAPALRSGARPSPIRIFWSSAVVIPAGEPNRVPPSPEPLVSEQCVEPIWWIAEQTLRQSTGLAELVRGFHSPSVLQDLAVQMAALAEPER